jgi:anti-anti-sigma factor
MSGSAFELTSSESGGDVVIHAAGELDLDAYPDLVLLLSETETGASGRRVVVELAHATFVDSTVLHALVESRNRQQEAGSDVVLRDPSLAVRHTLEFAGLADMFTIEVRRAPDA